MPDYEIDALSDEPSLLELIHEEIGQTLPSDEAANTMSTSNKKKRRTAIGDTGNPQTKAAREKQRRERLNQRFAILAELSSPEDPKTDKASILLDAITAIKDLTKQKEQLKQLNKCLEEKAFNYERERSFVLIQQSMMLGGNADHFSFSGLTQGGPRFQIEPENTVLGRAFAMPPSVDAVEPESTLDDFLHPPAA